MTPSQFEEIAREWFNKQGMHLDRNYRIPIGASAPHKLHAFDLGSDDPKVLVKCKWSTWTKGGHFPSAKIAFWNVAMYEFYLVSSDYRKFLFVLKSTLNGESLAERYIRYNKHLVPHSVEVWEYDLATEEARKVYPNSL